MKTRRKIKNMQNNIEVGKSQLSHFYRNYVFFSKLSSCDI